MITPTPEELAAVAFLRATAERVKLATGAPFASCMLSFHTSLPHTYGASIYSPDGFSAKSMAEAEIAALEGSTAPARCAALRAKALSLIAEAAALEARE